MKFIRLTTVEDKYWNEAWNLYSESFPKYEKRRIENHIEAMKNNNFYCEVVEEQNEFIGILFYWKLGEYKYLEHFATDPNLRGNGYGGKIIKEFCNDKLVPILEIDPPEDDISIRRKNFYGRFGFKMNSVTHTQLPYRKGLEGYQLKILTYPDKISEKEYNKFKKFLFTEAIKYVE